MLHAIGFNLQVQNQNLMSGQITSQHFECQWLSTEDCRMDSMP